jgi:uncharacterized protein (DUF58 family)
MRSFAPSLFRFDPGAALARAASAWARKRQGEDRAPLTLESRRLYILPTRRGLMAGALLFLMLLAGLNYNNSLALLLCFTLTGFALVSMYDCHRTLAGLQLLRAQAEPAFAEQHGELALTFENRHNRLRRGLALRCAAAETVYFDVPAHAATRVCIAFLARTRGWQRIDRVELATSTPLGLFRAWTWLHLPLDVLVYPQPLRLRPLPPAVGEQRRGRRSRRLGGEEEWASLRPFQDSDAPRSVAWKVYARGGPLMVAQYDAPAGTDRLLELARLDALPLERALSQLTAWVLDCERQGERYALRLPGGTCKAGLGPAQRRACLEALALYRA